MKNIHTRKDCENLLKEKRLDHKYCFISLNGITRMYQKGNPDGRIVDNKWDEVYAGISEMPEIPSVLYPGKTYDPKTLTDEQLGGLKPLE